MNFKWLISKVCIQTLWLGDFLWSPVEPFGPVMFLTKGFFMFQKGQFPVSPASSWVIWGSGWTETQPLCCPLLGFSFLLIILFCDSNFQKQCYSRGESHVIFWVLFLSLWYIIFPFKYLILKYFSQFFFQWIQKFLQNYTKMTFHNGSYRKNRLPLAELFCFTMNSDRIYLLVGN